LAQVLLVTTALLLLRGILRQMPDAAAEDPSSFIKHFAEHAGSMPWQLRSSYLLNYRLNLSSRSAIDPHLPQGFT